MRRLQSVFGVVVFAGLLGLTACGQESEGRGVVATRPAAPRPASTFSPELLARLAQISQRLRMSTTTPQPTPPPTTTTTRPEPQQLSTGSGSVNGYPCGASLPPCYVLYRESHGIPTIVEGGGSPYTHASGLWQFMPRTWNGYAGFPYASAAPSSVQNAKARDLWAGGAGCSHWSAC